MPRALVHAGGVSIHFNLIFAAMVDAEVTAHGDLMCDYALDFASRSREEAAGAGLLDEYSLLAKIYEPVGALLEQYDVLRVPDDRHSRARRRRLVRRPRAHGRRGRARPLLRLDHDAPRSTS